ncbi:hypothetical protein [Streptomyces sp. NPDC047868]|uniref:hypothetical protein n=1 Tax=Streptomyces sp. NPDC047868 TaxID=3155480 RepID=UPI0034538A91
MIPYFVAISAKAVVVSLLHQGVLRDAFAEVSHFRSELYACLTARGDALFELCDALPCTEGFPRRWPGLRRFSDLV